MAAAGHADRRPAPARGRRPGAPRPRRLGHTRAPSTSCGAPSPSRPRPSRALVAEVVLRPPDLRHLDAAVSAIAVDTRGTEGGLRLAIEGSYASRCPGCGGSVTVDEFIWDAEAAIRRVAHSAVRAVGTTGPMAGPSPSTRTTSIDPAPWTPRRPAAMLRDRFATPTPGHGLPDELVDLYPPRAQVALAALSSASRVSCGHLRCRLRCAWPSCTWCCRSAGSTATRDGWPACASAAGQVRGSSSRQWRERNAWSVFEEGTRAVRAFVQALDAGGSRTPARVGPDLRALMDGSANVALRFGHATGPGDVRAAPATGCCPRSTAPRGTRRQARPQPAAHPLVGG